MYNMYSLGLMNGMYGMPGMFGMGMYGMYGMPSLYGMYGPAGNVHQAFKSRYSIDTQDYSMPFAHRYSMGTIPRAPEGKPKKLKNVNKINFLA